MDMLHAIILGIVEGVTEFLPISSTGHLILAGKLFHIPDGTFTKTFDIAIQSGAILAVVALYPKRFLEWETLKKLIAGFIPTGVIGLLLYTTIKAHLSGNAAVTLWALGVGGVLLILFELFRTDRVGGAGTIGEITLTQAAVIGLAQSVAVIPGVSRSAASIVGGLLLGIRREAIAEFSFLLAVPTLLAATAFDLAKNYASFSAADALPLIAGSLAAFLVAIVSIHFLLRYVRSHTFIPFGIYRIAAVLIFLAAVPGL